MIELMVIGFYIGGRCYWGLRQTEVDWRKEIHCLCECTNGVCTFLWFYYFLYFIILCVLESGL